MTTPRSLIQEKLPTGAPGPQDLQDTPPAGKDPYEDSAEVRELISTRMDKAMEKARNHRMVFEREWFFAIQMYAGNHWIFWDRARGAFRQRNLPYYVPTPVTNKVAEKANDNMSSLLMTPPEMSWEPRAEDASSIAAAEIADRVDEMISEEVGRTQNDRALAAWVVLTGNAFVESYYDPSDEYGMALVQFDECATCGLVAGPQDFEAADGKCPHCGGLEVRPARERTGSFCSACREDGQEDPGANGSPYPAEYAFTPCPLCQAAMLQPTYGPEKVGEMMPRGKMCERIRSPFELFADFINLREFTRDGGMTWAVVSEMMDYKEAKDKYKIDLGSGTVVSGKSSGLSMQYLQSLSVLTSMIEQQIVPSGGVRGAASGSAEQVNREHFYELPSKRFPLGLDAIRIQGADAKVVEWGPLRFHETDENGKPDQNRPFIPIQHFGFHRQPGRAYGRTPISDIIPLNISRNKTESQMMLCESRMASPGWILPDGVMVRDPTGEPGELVRFQHVSAGQGRPPEPKRFPGIDPPQHFFRRIQQLDEQMEELSGSFAIAHGKPPRGVTAASALALLGERQQRSVSPQVQSWEMGQEGRARQQMFIFREYGVHTRIRPRKEGISKWAFEEWSAADLGGNISVRVVPGSAMPKSRAALAATVEAEIKMGLVDVTNPEVRRRVHEIYGTTQLVEPYQIDVKDAQRENELFLRLVKGEDGGKPFRLRPMIDNHPIHIAEHTMFAKGDEFIALEDRANANPPDPEAQIAVTMFYDHLQKHGEVMAAAMAPPPGEEPEPGGKKPEGRPEGSGKVLGAGRKDPTGENGAISVPTRMDGV